MRSNTQGKKTVSSVKWTFGDESTETVNNSTSHICTAAGSYTVKADVTVTEGKESCTSSHTRTITVN